MKKLYCFCMFFSLVAATVMPAAGQITITASDVSAAFAPGTATTTRIDTSTHTANIGSLKGTSWDFSALTPNFSTGAVSVAADTTQFFGMFPGATHALKEGGGYSYFTLSSNLTALGFAMGGATPISAKYIPAQVIYQLPMTLGTTWTATYVDSSYFTLGGTTYGSRSDQVVAYTVDAFGQLTLPGGFSYQALRLKSDRHSTTNGFTLRSITYQLVTKEGAALSIVPSDTNQPQTGTISVSTLSWNLPAGVTAVGETHGGDVPSGFALGQNYPNPFNPVTTIHYQLPVKTHVTLKVYDLVGREIATLADAVQEPGEKSVVFDANTIASGMYFYRLEAGSFIETKKLVLIR